MAKPAVHIRSFYLPVSACTNCGRQMDGATAWNEGKVTRPEPGDKSICAYCGHLMVFADDLTLRDPNDNDIMEVAGHPKYLFGQAAMGAFRKWRSDWHNVPVPDRMKHLPRDPRGFPIFAMAYRDADGKAHFTVNDERVRRRLIEEDRCSICAQPLLRGRWFVGGEKSAFSVEPRGAYIDPPMHAECARYALRVCPYLASPSYAKLLHGATMRPDDPTLVRDQTAIDSPASAHEVRPEIFVAVLARGQRFKLTAGGGLIFPKRPYISVEYWQHGWKLAREEGEAHCRRLGVEPE